MIQSYNYLLLPLLFTLSHSLSYFSPISDLTVSILLPAEFNCWVSHDSPIILTWIHNTNVFTCGGLCTPNIAGYSFGFGVSQSASLYKMTIESVEVSGSVTCKATQISNGSFITTTATLTVRDVANFLRIPITQLSNLGDIVMFDCIVNKGGGTFVWKRGDSVLDPNYPRYTVASFADNSTLTITGLTAVDIAEYSCEYSLSGDVINSTANLILSDYIVPYILTGSVQQVNLVFGPTAVTCPVEGNPIPTDITWYHNGIQVPTSSNQGPYSTAGVLQFDLATESDSGMYTCIANNGIAIANGTVSVKITTLEGVLTRWYVIMGICVAIISVACVSAAFVLSLICCCCDRRNEQKLEEKYKDRIRQIKSRRTQRSIKAKQLESAKATQVQTSVGDNKQQTRRLTQPPNIKYTERNINPDGSVTYSVKRESVQVNVGGTKRPNTVSEIAAVIAERPPTHLPRQTK